MPIAPFIAERNVFDAWAWCESDVIEWRAPIDGVPFDRTSRIDADVAQNPSNLVFVLRCCEDGARSTGNLVTTTTTTTTAATSFLPTELASLHAIGYGLGEEDRALAPWAIDDATDLFYEHRARPRDVLWLAASSLDALVWGLHDWVHFHNHGPFDQPAMTELQCDLVAIAWLRLNASTIGITDEVANLVACDLATLSRRRFEQEGVSPPVDDLEALFVS